MPPAVPVDPCRGVLFQCIACGAAHRFTDMGQPAKCRHCGETVMRKLWQLEKPLVLK